MTSPAPMSPQTPPPGMPKWLVALLIVGLVLVLGCGCGFATCRFMCSAVGTGIRAATQAGGEAVRNANQTAQNAAAEAARRAAEEGRTAPTPAEPPAGQTPPAPPAPPAPGDQPAPRPNNNPAANMLPPGNAPANFPADIPIMKGLAPTGLSAADKLKGSGMGIFTGKVVRTEVASYYEKEMVRQGWKIEANNDFGPVTQLAFTKDKRSASITISPNDDKDTSVSNVTIGYETKGE